jgi:hypothetical protein
LTGALVEHQADAQQLWQQQHEVHTLNPKTLNPRLIDQLCAGGAEVASPLACAPQRQKVEVLKVEVQQLSQQ